MCIIFKKRYEFVHFIHLIYFQKPLVKNFFGGVAPPPPPLIRRWSPTPFHRSRMTNLIVPQQSRTAA